MVVAEVGEVAGADDFEGKGEVEDLLAEWGVGMGVSEAEDVEVQEWAGGELGEEFGVGEGVFVFKEGEDVWDGGLPKGEGVWEEEGWGGDIVLSWGHGGCG